MSAQPVDVLAVLDRHVEWRRGWVPEGGADLAGQIVVDESNPHTIATRARLAEAIEARAAVAELIDMARIADEALNRNGIGLSRGDGLTLRAALARCTGDAA